MDSFKKLEWIIECIKQFNHELKEESVRRLYNDEHEHEMSEKEFFNLMRELYNVGRVSLDCDKHLHYN